jgi:hemoglobin
MSESGTQSDHQNEAETKPSFYQRIGGAEGVGRLVDRFYALMDELPEAAACRAIHPPSLEGSRQSLFEYLSYWLGGPQTYVERRGHPMLRARHLHAPIGNDETVGWLVCFHRAWTETVADPELGREILPSINNLALNMRNKSA